MKKYLFIPFLLFCLCSCTIGPDYEKPSIAPPQVYKEAQGQWKISEPSDECQRGEWWKIFKDPKLNELIDQLNQSNQSIAMAEAQFRQAKALVDQARASYSPMISTQASSIRQKPVVLSFPNATVKPYTDNQIGLNATWEPDFWQSIGRSVEASEAGAESSAAALASMKLSAQATLGQYYFELQALDLNQNVLNENVEAYRKLWELTKNRYAQGVAAQLDVVLAYSQLQAAEVQAIDNGIQRAQYEHAIAVLMGKAPCEFSIPRSPLMASPPEIPLQIPSLLLERRPDVAQAERQMKQANAEVGVAIAGYFPVFTLTGSGGYESGALQKLFALPSQMWSFGPQMVGALLDGGLMAAKTEAAKASYDASVANYRQTVLAAFQDVEDNLASLRILKSEVDTQNDAVKSARQALKLTLNEYKAGTVSFSDVITAQTAVYTAEKTAASISSRLMTSAVGLVKALGGGWEASSIKIYEKSS